MLEDLRSGETTASDLLEAHIARQLAVDPAINAVIRTDLPSARARARELDRMAKSGRNAGPLHGLPITIKDTFDVEGMPATAGAPEYALRPGSTPDAPAVARLRAAGAVIWGKTNTPYLAGDNQTSNPLHGRTNNPHDLARTPGGSSGGAAAALAMGLTPLELGSDIGGSLRIPAHFCGVATLKPTFGRAPIRGHVPPAPGSVSVRDLNVAGPMARNVGDLRLMFETLAATTPPAQRRGLKGRRLGVWASEPGFLVSAECGAAIDAAAQAADDLGAHVAIAKPDVAGEALLDLYLRLLLPILASDMPGSLLKAMEAGRPIARLLARREPFSRAKWALYSAATHHDWLIANEARERLRIEVSRFFSQRHALLMPVAPATAFEHVENGDSVTRRLLVDGAPAPYHAFHAWIALASICHLPSVVIPIRRAPGQLPCGVQIVGPEGGDFDVLAIAEALESEIGGFAAPPEEGFARPLELTLELDAANARTKAKGVKAPPRQKPVKPVKEKPVRKPRRVRDRG